jgi:molybdate transport system substrate-binding protein
MRRLLLSLLASAVAGAPATAQEPGTLTIYAAASLSSAFEELGAAFRRSHPDVELRFNFAGSQQLAVQLEHGGRADLFASADERWMRYAADRGLLAQAPRIFARNRLVVVAPAGEGPVRRLADLARPGIKLVLAAEAVPAGKYSRAMLARLEGAPGIPRDFARAVLANLVSEEENVRGVAAKVQLGEADAGVVYASDVTGSPRLRAIPIPDDRNVIADYPIAALRGSASAAPAEAFVGLLLGPEGQGMLQRHGFLPIPAPAGSTAPAGR